MTPTEMQESAKLNIGEKKVNDSPPQSGNQSGNVPWKSGK